MAKEPRKPKEAGRSGRAGKHAESRSEESIPHGKAAMEKMLNELRDAVEAHRESERKLAESEAQYRAVIETTTDGFWMVDGKGHILVTNDAYVRRSGYSREELLEISIADVDAQETRTQVRAHIAKVRREGSDLFETWHRAKDGTLWPVEINVARREAAGDHLFIFIRDISERKQAERDLRDSELRLAVAEANERRRLAQDLHDDLGQLMAVVKLKIGEMAALKLSKLQRAKLIECAEVVDLANRKMRSMTFQLSPPMLEERGLPASIRWLADEMQHFYKLTVRVDETEFPSRLDPLVNASLYRAIRELLINVARHAGVEHASVQMAVAVGNRLVVTVSDGGIGFDPEGNLLRRDAPGYGLASIAQQLRRLGGEMHIESKPGDGTAVVLSLPLRNAMSMDEPPRKRHRR